jgi:hypothetical protein
VITAAGVIVTKGLRPIFKFGARAEVMLPLMQEMTIKFRDVPAIFDIVVEIVGQFRTDSGSSLRDVVNRLEDSAKVSAEAIEKLDRAATDNRVAAEVLKVNVEAVRQLAAQDRAFSAQDRTQLVKLLTDLTVLTVKVDTSMQAIEHIKTQASGVAVDLAVAQLAVDGVAADLAKSHQRADEAPAGDAGAAADAASRNEKS